MVFKFGNGEPFKFFFLTKGMSTLLARQSIPVSHLDRLSVYHGFLTYGEIAEILKYQFYAAKTLGVIPSDPLEGFPDDLDTTMLRETFNGNSSEGLLTTLRTAESFEYLSMGNTIVLVTGKNSDEPTPGYSKLQAGTLSAALLETLYKKVGYMVVHGVSIVHPGRGEFTMAEVFRLLSTENP